MNAHDEIRDWRDDPRLTAYAFGELEGDDRAAVEALLEENDEARRMVDELRAFGGELETELSQTDGAADSAGMTAAQRAAIDAKLGAAPGEATVARPAAGRILGFRPSTWRIAAGLAIVGVGSVLAWDQLRGGGATGSAQRESSLDGSAIAQLEKRDASEPKEQRRLESLGYLGEDEKDGLADAGAQVASRPARSQDAVEIIDEETLNRLREQGYGGNDGTGSRASEPAAPRASKVQMDPGLTDALEGLGYVDVGGSVADAPQPVSGPDLEALRSLGYLDDDGESSAEERVAGRDYKGPGDTVARGPRSPGSPKNRVGGKAKFRNTIAPVGGADDAPLGRREASKRFDDDGREGDFRQARARASTEAYDQILDNAVKLVADEPLSTFSIDVDTASYANVRRFLVNGQLPPADAVRIEELVNYFDYEYLHPRGDEPFGVDAEVAECPWAPGRQLVRIGLQGRTFTSPIPKRKNLVFLLDVSGSMNSDDKLPLLKQGFRMLVGSLAPEDRVAIVVYAGASGVVLPSTSGRDQQAILGALDRLSAGGSTNGGAGIELAYQIATEHFIEGGINRVILATDGDFNVGTTSQGELVRLIERKRESGVFLSVLGFGQANLKDSQMEQIADHGNGAYHYIDSEREAKKVLVRELDATLETIAKDVKIQVEFNPAYVQGYRLVGYANRLLAAQDFNDDTKDAGEIGAGHTVTAFYEVVPVGAPLTAAGVDPLKYQPASEPAAAAQGLANGELLNVKLRYKRPDGDASVKREVPVPVSDRALADTGDDFRFAAAVALFGMVLRDSEHAGSAGLGAVLALAESGAGPDPWGDRAEFLQLVQRAQELRGRRR